MKKKITATLLISILFVFLCGNVYAADPVFADYLDNDEADNPYGYNSWYGTWDYLTGSAHYRGDSRIAVDKVGYLYMWGMYKSRGVSSSNPRIYVYLNDIKFTCPNALYVYYAYNGDTQIAYLQQRINQNTAPAGWSYVGSAPAAARKIISHVTVTPTQSSTSGYVGADGVKITLN